MGHSHPKFFSTSSVQRINNIIRRKHMFHMLILQCCSSKLQAECFPPFYQAFQIYLLQSKICHNIATHIHYENRNCWNIQIDISLHPLATIFQIIWHTAYYNKNYNYLHFKLRLNSPDICHFMESYL